MPSLNDYHFSRKDFQYAATRGFSGAPYAKRHWDLSRSEANTSTRWGHRVIAVIEYIPLLGALAAGIDRLSHKIKNPSSGEKTLQAKSVKSSSSSQTDESSASSSTIASSIPSQPSSIKETSQTKNVKSSSSSQTDKSSASSSTIASSIPSQPFPSKETSQTKNVKSSSSSQTDESSASIESNTLDDEMVSVIENFINNPDLFKSASDELKDNKQVVLALVKSSSRFFQPLSESSREGLIHTEYYVKNPRKFTSSGFVDEIKFLESVKSWSCFFQFASERLRGDLDVILAAVERYPDINAYIVGDFTKNRDVVLACIETGNFNLENLTYFTGNFMLRDLPHFQDDEEVVLAALKRNKTAFDFASERLKDTENVIKVAIRGNYYYFKYASDRLKSDKDFILSIIGDEPDIYEFLSDTLKDDEDVLAQVTKKNDRFYRVVEYASVRLRGKKEIMLKAVASKYFEDALKYASVALQDDEEVVEEAVKKAANEFKHASPRLKNDKQFVLKLIRAGYDEVFRFLSDDFRNDEEVALAAYQQNKYVWRMFALGNRLKNNQEFLSKLDPNDLTKLQDHWNKRKYN